MPFIGEVLWFLSHEGSEMCPIQAEVSGIRGLCVPSVGQRPAERRSGLTPPHTHTHPSLQPTRAAGLWVSSAPGLPAFHLTSFPCGRISLPTTWVRPTSTLRTNALCLLEGVALTALLTSKSQCPFPLLPSMTTFVLLVTIY